MKENFLQQLNIKEINSGASYDLNGWSHINNQCLLNSYNPTNEEIIAKVSLCSEQDYQHIMERSSVSFNHWRQIPAAKRGEVIRLISERLRTLKSTLGNLVAMETGKSKQEGDGEVQEMIDMADFAVGQSRMLYGKTMHSERPAHRMYEQWHPLGIVGVITSFNFPVAVWAWNAFIAAITGNTIIWKPSPKTPLCAIAVQHICNQVMAEQGYSAVFSLFIPKDNIILDNFINDKRIPLISFTGSTHVGQIIAEKVANRLGRTILELSGNNAVIVDETANLDLAIPAIIFGAIGTTGQRCTTIRRLIVHESKIDAVISNLKNRYQDIQIGDPLDENKQLGPLIDSDAVKNYISAIKEITAMGGEILYGGRVLERTGFFVEPTLVKAENHWDIVQKETFAPILYIISYRNLEEAIALNNDVRQGLSSAMFTQNLQNAEHFLSAIGSDCGIANINIGTSGAEIGGAFGGEKDTGGGREAGSDAWKAYMRRQTTTINWSNDLPLAQGIQFKINR